MSADHLTMSQACRLWWLVNDELRRQEKTRSMLEYAAQTTGTVPSDGLAIVTDQLAELRALRESLESLLEFHQRAEP